MLLQQKILWDVLDMVVAFVPMDVQDVAKVPVKQYAQVAVKITHAKAFVKSKKMSY